MGVKDLWTILAPVKKPQSIASLRGQTIAVDLSVWVCESVTVKPMQGRVVKPYLRNLFFRVSNLLQLGVKLVFVIDGVAPELKWEEMTRRTQARYPANGRKGKPTKKGGRSNFKVWLKECQEMLSYLGVPCVQSKGEAEAMCAVLDSHGVVDACLTEDGDAFLYGARTVYRNFTLNTKDPHVDCYSMTDIEQDLGLDRDKLVALALLIGCDYLPKGVVGVGKEQGCQLMRQLSHVKVLQRFESWADGRMNCTQVAKPSHCRICTHIGTTKQHKMRGCVMCGTQCQPNMDTQCYCEWHKAQSRMDGTPLERDIMRKALRTAGFPFKAVISEFLDNRDTCPASPLHWSRPQLQAMQKYNLIKLEWPEDYTMEKVFPLITLWDLTQITNDTLSSKGSLVLERFVKTRTRQGVPCIEVQWIRPDWNGKDDNSKFYTTIEKEELLASCYPDKYNTFMEDRGTRVAKASNKSKEKKKPKADLDAEDVTYSQQLPAAISNAVDDESLDCLVTSVMSLQISKTHKTGNKFKGTKQEKDTKKTEENLSSLEESKESTLHSDRRTTSQIVTSGKTSCKERENPPIATLVTSEEGGLCKTPVSPMRTGTKTSRRNRLADSAGVKTANTSADLNLLEELLEYEATQSCVKSACRQQCVTSTRSKVKGPMDDKTRIHVGVDKSELDTEGSDDRGVDREILPLFQRIRLKSVKGTNIRKAKSGTSDFQQVEHISSTEILKQGNQCNRNKTPNSREEMNEPVKEEIWPKQLQNSFPECDEVIVIDSDSDEGNMIREKLDITSKSKCSVAAKSKHNTDNVTNQEQKCDDDASSVNYQTTSSTLVEISPESSLQTPEKGTALAADMTASTARSSEDADFTAVSTYYPTAMVADETAVADYRLIQTTVSSENNQGIGEAVTSSYATTPVVLTSPSIMNSDIPGAACHSVKSTPVQRSSATSATPTAMDVKVLPTNVFNPHTDVSTPTCNITAAADITASSTNSYWCDDSQMSLFDSPSFAEFDPLHNRTESNMFPLTRAINSNSTADNYTAIDSNSTADNYTAIDSTAPHVIDMDTPDIPEEFSPNGKENCRKHIPSDIQTKVVKPYTESQSPGIGISPGVIKLNTPGIPEEINEDINTTKSCNVNCVTKSPLTSSALVQDCLYTTHQLESRTARPNRCGNPGLVQHIQCDNMNEDISRVNVTCVPVALNCDTPVMATNYVSFDERACVNPTDQSTPHNKRQPPKPHTLQLEALQSSVAEAGVVDCYQRHVRCDDMVACEDDRVIPDRDKITRVNNVQKQDDNIESSPVCLLDRLRKKFEKCGDKRATLSAMSMRSKPR